MRVAGMATEQLPSPEVVWLIAAMIGISLPSSRLVASSAPGCAPATAIGLAPGASWRPRRWAAMLATAQATARVVSRVVPQSAPSAVPPTGGPSMQPVTKANVPSLW